MPNSLRFPTLEIIRSLSGTFLGLLLLTSPVVVLAHAGHGNEFSGEGEVTPATSSIQVDEETVNRLGIKVEPVKRQRLALSIKTTGQIENLPSKQVEITTPIAGAKVVEILVEPGASVKQGQPVAVVSSLEMVSLRVESQEKLAQGQADLQQALADLRLAQQNRDRYQQITTAEITQAQTQVAFAEEKYNKDKQLADAGALPQRTVLESQTQLAEAKAQLTKANSRREVIAAENHLQRAQAAVEVAKTRINLSNNTYNTRLQQLGIRGNSKGLVTVTSPISGQVADREVTLGQTFEDAGGKLMTIVNDSRVFATANIYEKDLDKIRAGQRVTVKIAGQRTFTGRITVINSVVAGDTQVVPVKAEIDNPGGVLKPGMFAELEVLTNQTSPATLVIPSAAVVEANNKKLVYIQNGNAYQAVEVTLGQTSGDMVEVLTGLFAGDKIVTQRAPQLYAQSLRVGVKAEEHGSSPADEKKATSNASLPWWIPLGGGTALTIVAFMSGTYWANRQTKTPKTPIIDQHSKYPAPPQ
ncbi:efflux RND transporter periplasmic adaptor subunit [Anabaena subtropica]|uniref:Efflux RND transporter periplasmic adaptor subunit n=1 Tax=Anabaena subtropica FACHB-260 TaxID=2692884 RepID=A0ABR8CJE8_9NOST|nr:efflux RND transporter periplasmic adaptor subunit [Anabaena subtropica]MBD2343366.1 efflux RND transporter periplasmic adaptor subunit [Anabaena subtropica FACHB-260]